MTIPEYQTVVLPLLNLAADGEEHKLRDAIEELADHFDLTEDERKELLPSVSQATFDNRVCWARTYMKKACFWNPHDAATSGSRIGAYGPWSRSPR